MTYKIYVYEGYLKLIKSGVGQEELETYGILEEDIFDGYKENNPNHVGYKFIKETGKGFTTVKVQYYAFKEVV